ncbi:hypothetical protein [Aquimarina agarivorans]|uniref:hypothetical protein n=1 Tax=Aquimarina agarivorans TaxID=980584 RepID=UPI000248F8CB|nr:hypothetical protein [Aquimarina agarivorans]
MSIKPAYKLGYVAYFEMNIDTIIEKYCVNKDKPIMKCNGKCHLSKKLSLTQIDDSLTSERQIATSLIEAFIPVYFTKTQDLKSNKFYFSDTKKVWFHTASDYLVSLSITSPPPQV